MEFIYKYDLIRTEVNVYKLAKSLMMNLAAGYFEEFKIR